MGTLATDDRDKELGWFFGNIGNIVWEIVTMMLSGLPGNFDRQMFFPLFCWSTRDHSSLVKSTYEEHLCVVALTSSERETQFHRLPVTSSCDP